MSSGMSTSAHPLAKRRIVPVAKVPMGGAGKPRRPLSSSEARLLLEGKFRLKRELPGHAFEK